MIGRLAPCCPWLISFDRRMMGSRIFHFQQTLHFGYPPFQETSTYQPFISLFFIFFFFRLNHGKRRILGTLNYQPTSHGCWCAIPVLGLNGDVRPWHSHPPSSEWAEIFSIDLDGCVRKRGVPVYPNSYTSIESNMIMGYNGFRQPIFRATLHMDHMVGQQIPAIEVEEQKPRAFSSPQESVVQERT